MDSDSFDHDEEDAVAPLRWFGSSTIPPTTSPRPTAVARQDFERLRSNALSETKSDSSEHSQSQRFAASPLDKIPSNLYTHFPRFSTTTENSSPDLSTEEVTSTRLSIDEHVIIEVPPSTVGPSESAGKRQWLHTALHRAISNPSLGLRRMKDKLCRTSSSTLSGNTLRQEAMSMSEQQSQCNTDQISGTDVNSQSNSAKASPEESPKEIKVLQLKRRSKEVLTGTYSKLSTLTERELDHDAPIYRPQQRPLLDEPAKHFQPLSSRALKALDDLMDASVTPASSYHSTPDHLSSQASSFFSSPSFAVQDTSLPRATSSRRILPGSIDELRSNAFLAASQRAYSFSGSLLGRSSQSNVNQTPRSASVARPVTLFDVEDVGSLKQLRQDPLFVDMPNGHQTNFIFPPSAEESSGRTVPHSLRSLKPRSYRNLRQTQNLPLLIRSTSIKKGLEHAKYQQKVPLYTPSRIVTPREPLPSFPRRISSLAQADPTLQTWNGINNAIPGASESSTKRQSKVSEWSTKEDRAYFREGDHPSLRSEDPSVKSGDLRPWWKGQKFLAGFKKVVPHRPALGAMTGSGVPLGAESEKNNCKEPFKRNCRFYARRTRQKLWGSYLQDGTEKRHGHGHGHGQ